MPHESKAQHALWMVVGGIHPFDGEKQPQGVELSLQSSGERPGIILAVPAACNQSDEPGTEGAPFPTGWLARAI